MAALVSNWSMKSWFWPRVKLRQTQSLSPQMPHR